MLVEMTSTHVPVLAGELVDLLDPQPGEVAVDCTFGGGGHALALAERIGPTGRLIAIDRDPAAAERYTECRLGQLATHMLAGIDEDTVDFQPNYDESLSEPAVMPTRTQK